MNSYTEHTTTCPSPKQWLRYRRGLCSHEEAHAIETHFTACPLCSTAVDYIMSTEADVLAAEWHLLETPDKKEALLPKRGLSRVLVPWSIAAATLFAIAGAYVLFQQNQESVSKPLAQNELRETRPTQKALPLNADAPQTETASTQTIKSTAPATIKATEKAVIAQTEKTPHKGTMPQQSEPAIVDASESITAQSAEADMPVSESRADKDIAVKTLAAPAAAQPVVANNRSTIAREKADATIASEENLKKRNVTAFSAQKGAQPVSADNNNLPQQAIALYQQQAYNQALPLLEQALQAAPDNEALRFYLADTYLKTGNNKKAEKALKNIVKQKGPYAKQAQQLLDLLKHE